MYVSVGRFTALYNISYHIGYLYLQPICVKLSWHHIERNFDLTYRKGAYLVCMVLQRQFVCLFTIWCLLVSYIMLCLATDGAVAHEVCDFNQTFLHVLFVKLCYNSNSVSKLQKNVQFKLNPKWKNNHTFVIA